MYRFNIFHSCCLCLLISVRSYYNSLSLKPNNLFLCSKLFSSSPTQDSVLVIGSGPAGLSAAVMLARRGFENIKLYDRLSEPPPPHDLEVWGDLNADRSYNIGINGRGQKTLRNIGALSKIENFATTVIGRRDWTPESPLNEPREIIFTNRKTYMTKCIQRDRLTAALLEYVRENYSNQIKIVFNTDVKDIEWMDLGKKTEKAIITLSRDEADTPAVTWKEESYFIIGADGANSIIRSKIESSGRGFKAKRFEDNNVRVYRTIPIYFPNNDMKKWRKDLNYSVRTKFDINIDALPTLEGPYVGVVLFRPWDEKVMQLKSGADAKRFFEIYFPMFAPFIEEKDYEIFAQKKNSKLPVFSYFGPQIHKGRTTCLIGDSIHTVKPYFGMGVNSAFEDVYYLDMALNKTNNDIPQAIKLYSKQRSHHAKALVEISRKLDGGFFVFVLPLIVDSILNRLLPWMFNPNTITCLQNDNWSFSEVQRRKRMDRIKQVGLGVLLGSSLWYGLKIAFKFMLKLRLMKLF